MPRDEVAFAGVARQAELIAAGEVSPRELVELYLERISRLDPELNAYRVVMAERALAEAEQAEARLRAGDRRPLLGVPIAIKDNVDVAGELTTHGTNAHSGRPAQSDAEVVRRVRAAGAVILGKVHMPELAIWPFTESATFGYSRNPWDPQHGTGGSSGASASAVAAGLAAAAQGSDGAGSIRIPAASNGVFGLKPSRGRISLAPQAEHWNGLSVLGWLTRTVRDTAILLDATAGPMPVDAEPAPSPAGPFVDAAARRPQRLRVALSFSAPPGVLFRLDDECREATLQTADLLRALGHEVREADPSYGPVGPACVARYVCGIAEDAGALPHPDRLERRTKGIARMGRLVGRRGLAAAKEAEAEHASRIGALFAEHDVLLTPALARPPLRLGELEGRGAVWSLNASASFTPFTPVWNHIGHPAAIVPAGMSSGGLPLGVQLVARRNDEATLLSLSAQIESERPWDGSRPPLS